jgi:uncharacterized protein YeaO (DUF488 family)
MKVKIKRAYESPERDDGCRILVDRLWPRGLKKEAADVDIWLKEIAPTTSLRKEFGHVPAKWKGFKEKYLRELHANTEPVSILKGKMKKGPVTLLYAAKDEEHNHALALLQYVTGRKKRPSAAG